MTLIETRWVEETQIVLSSGISLALSMLRFSFSAGVYKRNIFLPCLSISTGRANNVSRSSRSLHVHEEVVIRYTTINIVTHQFFKLNSGHTLQS